MIEIKLAPDERSEERLDRLLSRLTQIAFSFAPYVKRKAADRIRLGFQRNFESESAGGAPWHELAPWTQEERDWLRLYKRLPILPEHPILRRTGRLRDSLVNAHNPLHVSETDTGWTRVRLMVGSDDPRFEILHAGGTNDDGYYVPPRPMTVLSPADLAGLRETLEWCAAEMAKNSFGA